MKPLIVIFSHDPELYLVLSHILEVDGFTCALAGTIEETFELAADRPVRAILLDCRRNNQIAATCSPLKQDARTMILSVVALLAPGAETQHVALLKSGIDECFVRPTAPAKLLDYLRSRLSRCRSPGLEDESDVSLSYSDIEMQIKTHRVRRNGREILLGPIEFKLLRHMLQNPEKVLSRDELIGAAWPSNVFVDMRTVDVHISRLRTSLKEASANDVIRTVRLVGYALEARTA